MNNTCTMKQNGKFEIVVNGKTVRKDSAKAFPFAYDFNGDVRLSNDGQLRRLRGAPIVIPLFQEIESDYDNAKQSIGNRICAICDGGPGNLGVCLCGHRAYSEEK